MQTHSIDHQTLKEAAANLTTIADAGYIDQLRRDFGERMADPQARTTWRDPMRDWQIQERAELLALLTDAPLGQCRAALSAGDSPRRDLGLRLLSEMAGQVRQLQAQAHRQYRSPRRAG